MRLNIEDEFAQRISIIASELLEREINIVMVLPRLLVSERTKLVALLAGEKITTWARFGIGRPNDLLKRDGETWNNHSFHSNPKGEGTGTINQTFLRSTNPIESRGYYDVCLNYAQLRRVWPTLSITRTKCDIR